MNPLDRLNLGLGRKLPLVLQSEASECGLACLAMIAHYHGREIELSALRRQYGASLKGVTLPMLMRAAEGVGFVSRPLRVELWELPKLKLPCILHWDMNHFVVLEAIRGERIVIHDPANGRRVLHASEASRHVTGVVLELAPTSGFATAKPQSRVKITNMLGQFRGIKSALGKVVGLAAAIEVFAIVSPLFLGLVVDQAIVGSDRSLLLTLIVGFALLLVLQTGIKAMRGWMLMGINASLKVQARGNLFRHLQNLPASFFDTRHLGDIMSRFGSQETILKAITSDAIEAILDGILATITLIIMLVLAPDLAAIVVFGAIVYALLRWVFYAPLRRASAEALVWSARKDSHFLESLRGVRTVKLFNAQESRRVHWLNLVVEAVNRQLTTEKLHLMFRILNSLLVGLLKIAIVGLGAVKILDGELTVGLLLAIVAYKDQFLGRITELINKVADLIMLRLDAERLADIALTEPETDAMPGFDDSTHLPAEIELRDVSFRYGENEPLVLDEVNLRIRAGESVAIVGPSGGGKSTLLKLMAGLLEPNSGTILVDGVPVPQIGLSAYRAKLGVVMQDDQLFAGSIADNICFFASNTSMERVEACAGMAAIHDDILAMPMGYGTLIGDMGMSLSGGQKQRVLIARALYREPSILLLDEATSHLDIEREHAVNQAIRQHMMTRVLIAHRPETIRSAERIVCIDRGKAFEVTSTDFDKRNFTDLKQDIRKLGTSRPAIAET